MAEGVTKDKQDIETWLLNFERLVGRPIVISLLVENGGIEFVSIIRKKGYIREDDTEDPDDGPPTVDFEQAKEDSSNTYLKSRDYIG